MLILLVVLCVLNLLGLIFVLIRQKSFDASDEFAQNRKEFAEFRQEISKRVEELRDKNDEKMEHIRKTVESRLEYLQKDNNDKLEKMRVTVDEKLQSTLEKRLTQSFKLVSERLELVQKGLGEMQNLASDVSDFKRVLTNVKTRGTWGEVQLENLLEQIFIKDHYEKQVLLKPGNKSAVDFCVKLPDKSSREGFIYLPIDAKFPMEDYQRLVAAQEKGNASESEEAGRALTARIKLEAKSIREKYILPPRTTDFAILYVPTEGLYAEILRTPGLFEQLQQKERVTVAGPTTISAILNSFQLGFSTLAIAEQTSNVWELLTTIRGEFGKFGGMLDKAKKKLQEAGNVIDDASSKSHYIEGKLNKVHKLEDKSNPPADEETTKSIHIGADDVSPK
jgi:DNA recombination protein RmuC